MKHRYTVEIETRDETEPDWLNAVEVEYALRAAWPEKALESVRVVEFEKEGAAT